jgi:hypothetical protein
MGSQAYIERLDLNRKPTTHYFFPPPLSMTEECGLNWMAGLLAANESCR